MWRPAGPGQPVAMSTQDTLVPTPPVAAAGTGPVPYHRLATTWPGARRWKPLLGLLIGAVCYVALALGALVSLVVGALVQGTEPDWLLLDADRWDLQDPAVVAFMLVGIGLLLPATWLGFRAVGCRPSGLLWSVAGRLRVTLLVRGLAVALPVFGVVFVADHLLRGGGAAVVPSGGLLLALVWVLLVPVQAAAEEYVFRGALAQVVGAWLRHPAWAILLPVPLFALGHDYNAVGLLEVALFGVAAGWLTWRTGGLEAAIAVHIANNLLLGVLGAAGWYDVNATDAELLDLVVGLVPVAVFVVWIESQVRRAAHHS
jgi:membrane protease YdiL (CAAX protease family)